MGCGGSKKSGKKEKLDMTMEKSGHADIDSLFTNMTEPLNTLAEIANMLRKAEDRMSKTTYSYLLRDPTLVDSITAMLYGFSAATDGDFDKIELKIQGDSPYIAVSHHKLPPDMHPVADAWNFLAEKIIDTGKKLITLPKQILDLVEESKELPDKAKAICTSSNMGLVETAKVLKVVGSNSAKAAKASNVLKEATDKLDQLLELLKSLPTRFRELNEIHNIGKEIHKSKLHTMKDIIVHHWPDKARVDLKKEKPPKKTKVEKTNKGT
jgi:uncharacterized protein YfeS